MRSPRRRWPGRTQRPWAMEGVQEVARREGVMEGNRKEPNTPYKVPILLAPFALDAILPGRKPPQAGRELKIPC